MKYFWRRVGHLARIDWGEWSWKGTCKRQLHKQTTQWINFDTRRDIKYNKVFNICGHTYLTCWLYYQQIISNIQMSFFLVLFFLPSLNWEREYVIAILRKVGGRKQFKVLLSFSTGSFWEYFLFYGVAGFYIFWLEGVCYLLSKILSAFPRNFGDSFNRSYHANRRPETQLCFFTRSLAWDSPVRSRRPPSWKLISLFLFLLTKRVLLPLYGSGQSFSLFLLPSLCQAIHSDYYIYPQCSPSLSIRSQNANICWLSFWPGFVTSVARNWPTFLIPLLTVSLWRPVNSNTEG